MDLSQFKDLEALKRALDEFGSEDPEKGARLHAEKNSPAVAGMYSHLHFPPYQYQPYPKALYTAEYPAAMAEFQAALRVICRGDDQTRDVAIKQAEQRLAKCSCLVGTEAEQRQRESLGWADTPDGAVAKLRQHEVEVAAAAANLAYHDQKLSEAAKRERAQADDEAEGHLVDVRPGKKRGRPVAQPVSA